MGPPKPRDMGPLSKRVFLIWEVLNGVGVDGVGVIFPPFFTHYSPFLRIFPLFLRFSLLLLKDKGKQQQFPAKMGNFTLTRLHPPRAKLPEKKLHPLSPHPLNLGGVNFAP